MAEIYRILAMVLAVLSAPSFEKMYCENGETEEETVSIIIDDANTARQKLANGQQRNGGGDFLPPALYGLKNLTWNCDFESDLQSRIPSDCLNLDDDTVALKLFHQYIDIMDVYSLSVSQLSVQFPEVSDSHALEGYARVMNEKATTIGCVFYSCPNNWGYSVCLTESPPMKTGDVIYTIAESTVSTTTATTELDTSTSTMTSTPSTIDVQTSTSTMKITTMRATPITMTSTPSTINLQTSTSTMKITTKRATPSCTTKPKCVVTTTCRQPRNHAKAKREAKTESILKHDFQNSGLVVPIDKGSQICRYTKEMTDTLRLMFLDMHNYRRLVLSLGKLKRDGELLPEAKNMLKLVYDCGLEELATKHAKRCPSMISEKPEKGRFGENFYRVVKDGNASAVEVAVMAINSWWEAGDTTHLGPSVLFQETYLHTALKSFTQMAWATTKYLGCSVVDCRSFYVCICKYSPSGNIVGESVYKPGHSCSECGPGTTCEAEIGLCV